MHLPSARKVDFACSSETSTYFHNIPEDCILHCQRHENTKFREIPFPCHVTKTGFGTQYWGAADKSKILASVHVECMIRRLSKLAKSWVSPEKKNDGIVPYIRSRILPSLTLRHHASYTECPTS